MKNAVYCLAKSEEQADAILTHLRNLNFRSSEVSILLKDEFTKNISVKEDVVRGAEKGSLVGGALGALAGLTALTIPVVGPILAAGPIVAAIGGAAVGGVVGGLAGGSGALTRMGVPKDAAPRLEQMLDEGGIFIVVHSKESAKLDTALRVFKSSGADEIYAAEDLAA
jgi:hypothetical protein